jgi:hypothetical protein
MSDLARLERLFTSDVASTSDVADRRTLRLPRVHRAGAAKSNAGVAGHVPSGVTVACTRFRWGNGSEEQSSVGTLARTPGPARLTHTSGLATGRTAECAG